MIHARAYFGWKKYPYGPIRKFFYEFRLLAPIFIVLFLTLMLDAFRHSQIINQFQSSICISLSTFSYLLFEILITKRRKRQRAMSFFLNKKLLAIIASKKEKYAIEPHKLAYEFYHCYKKNKYYGPALKIFIPEFDSDLLIYCKSKTNKCHWTSDLAKKWDKKKVTIVLKEKAFLQMIKLLSLKNDFNETK